MNYLRAAANRVENDAEERLEALSFRLAIEFGDLRRACRQLVQTGEDLGATSEFWSVLLAAAEALDMPELCGRIKRHLAE